MEKMLRRLVVVAIFVGLVGAPLVVQATPITDLGVVYDATYALVSSVVGFQTYQVTVTAQTSGSTAPVSGDYLTALAIKIAPSISSFSLVSGPSGSVLVDGGVNASGCNTGGGGFVCDGFTPILMPDGLVTLIMNETIATGTLLTGNLAAQIKAEYCDVGTGRGTTGLGCPSGQNGEIQTINITLTPVPEPITMFLGGTGLLLLGYAARKRLFGGQRATAI
jgi:PEP-CTERM motif